MSAPQVLVLRPLAPRVPTHVITLERGCTLRILIDKGDDILASAPKLYTNHPLPGAPFYRPQRRLLAEVSPYSGNLDWIAELAIHTPGTFDLTLECKGAVVYAESFVVEPHLPLQRQGLPLPLDSVMVQTMLTKCLGPLKDWDSLMELPATSNFNVVHFSPMQELGRSNSCYSIYDQEMICKAMFPDEPNLSEALKEERIRAFLERNLERRLISVVDVVWNHTADNSPWLAQHPEAGYTSTSSLHLAIAFELDTALLNYSAAIVNGQVAGITTTIESEKHIRAIMEHFKKEEWQRLKIWEYLVVDLDAEVQRFKELAEAKTTQHAPPASFEELCRSLAANVTNSTYQRKGSCIDLEAAQRLFAVNRGAESATVELMIAHYERALRLVNLWVYQQLDKQLESIITNVSNRIKYERLEEGGPKQGPLSHRHPLIETYFVRVTSSGGQLIGLACNGWIWNADPRVDFAAPSSWSYVIVRLLASREVIVWSDCVKLRYGTNRDDNPWLWDRMAKYTAQMARLFHGFRVDNAHSTPLPVAQYMLDTARRVRPELYVTAELFTGSAELDAKYVAALGINSLIREAMNAGSPSDLSNTLYMYGVQRPVGDVMRNIAKTSVRRPPRALLFDCTHDNPTPAQKRTPADYLSNAALTSFASSAFGSTRGYDELIPRTIDIVTEKRLYRAKPVDAGILGARALMNKLHADLALNYPEMHVHQDGPLILMQRHNPANHEAVFLLAHTAYKTPPPLPSSLELPVGLFTRAIFVAQSKLLKDPSMFAEDTKFITGLQASLFVSTNESDFKIMLPIDAKSNRILINAEHFPPGSVGVFAMGLQKPAETAVLALRKIDVSAIAKLEYDSLNVLLYRCETEEFDTTGSRGYDIPGYGKLPYCGFSSLVALLDNDVTLGHPLFAHIRQGDWLIEYLANRLTQNSGCNAVRAAIKSLLEQFKKMPRHLIPCYFESFIDAYFKAARERFVALSSPFVKDGSDFVQRLALCSVQLLGVVPTAPLLARRPNAGSLAAGVPHFSSGFMRNWGRDTFISLRGLLLLTGRFNDAKEIILAYAACVRHGLVPNLLDGGKKPRFNCRDAPWWFLQAVQDYYKLAPEGDGYQLLATQVDRLFGATPKMTLAAVMQEILQAHATGIEFREEGAGQQLDAHMTSEGFNIRIRLDPGTGFVSGGSQYNCGTWMDKMGESQNAGNKGQPATPRDGASVEIVGLTASTVKWLASLAGEGRFPHKGVTLPGGAVYQYGDWAARLKQSFETFFYVPLAEEKFEPEGLRKDLVHRRGIYKDTLGATAPWGDYQLRPNMAVAMAVAPELFEPAHAANALRVIEAHLLGPLGMRTLDPADWAYRPDYVNSIDNGDKAISKGWNYHQGPEWLWPVGFYLRAVLHFAVPLGLTLPALRHKFAHTLMAHVAHIRSSLWCGLPELTNHNGTPCNDSCPSQAWSAATVLDALADLDAVPAKE